MSIYIYIYIYIYIIKRIIAIKVQTVYIYIYIYIMCVYICCFFFLTKIKRISKFCHLIISHHRKRKLIGRYRGSFFYCLLSKSENKSLSESYAICVSGSSF